MHHKKTYRSDQQTTIDIKIFNLIAEAHHNKLGAEAMAGAASALQTALKLFGKENQLPHHHSAHAAMQGVTALLADPLNEFEGLGKLDSARKQARNEFAALAEESRSADEGGSRLKIVDGVPVPA